MPGTGTVGAALACTTNPLGASGGNASFSGCAINTVGTDYRLRAAATISGNPLSVNSDQFNISSGDAAAPVIDCTVPDQSAWYGANVTVNCTTSDVGSGLANPADAAFSLSTSVSAGSEDPTAQTNSHQVCDNLTNCATAGPYTFKVDKKDPTVSCAAADGAWHGANVSIACTGVRRWLGPRERRRRQLQPVDQCGERHRDGECVHRDSHRGRRRREHVTAGPVTGNMVDRKDPEVSCGTADGAWHAANVSIACSASDGGSGLGRRGDATFSLSTSVAAGTETANASTGTRSIADAVGNSATAGPIAGNKVDKKAPQFSCGVADGLWHATDVSIGCTATDGGSGLANATDDASFNLSTDVACRHGERQRVDRHARRGRRRREQRDRGPDRGQQDRQEGPNGESGLPRFADDPGRHWSRELDRWRMVDPA